MLYLRCGTFGHRKVLQQNALQCAYQAYERSAMARATPRIVNTTLSYHEGKETVSIGIGTPAWFAWLDRGRLFMVAHTQRTFTVRKEQRRNGWYWYAYTKRDGRLHRCYLGRSCDMTLERLEHAHKVLFPAETAAYQESDLAHFLLGADSGNSGGTINIAAVRKYLAATITAASQRVECQHHQQLTELASLLLSAIEEERRRAAITEARLRQEVGDAQRQRANNQSDILWGQSTRGEVF